jgi:hypothetical protein
MSVTFGEAEIEKGRTHSHTLQSISSQWTKLQLKEMENDPEHPTLPTPSGGALYICSSVIWRLERKRFDHTLHFEWSKKKLKFYKVMAVPTFLHGGEI